jgi:acetoacetyl-CoA synthetase
MQSFMERMFEQRKINQCRWQDLYDWSIKDVNDFWWHLSEFVEVKWIHNPRTAFKRGTNIRNGHWFPDGKLNFAENLLPNPTDKIVMTAIAEGALRKDWTGLKLWNDVARCAGALKAAGVRPGDRVAGVLINGPEAVIAMLASSTIGAIWSSCSPDFGTRGIKDRLAQIMPKVVFATAAYQYGGKIVSNLSQTCEAVVDLMPAPKVITVDHFNRGNDDFSEFCKSKLVDDSKPLPMEFVPRSFGDPQYIMFSSGTTGLPKCIVHGVGGTLLQHKKELMLHSELHPEDRLLFFTTCGWMMWNWMVSALSVGASIVTFDGSPAYPSPELLWNICRDEGVTHFGTSPKFISVCSQHDAQTPLLQKALPKLRTILSTGSPLLPPHYEWVYRHFPDVHLASISGGTDIIGCFMLGNPILPVYSGEIQSPGLGMAIESWDDSERPVKEEKGELVCVRPFVSMPVGFWNDPDGERYRKAYFDHYQDRDVWRHGDFIEITRHGGVIVYGRSDATLNPGGVRIGTSEIYRAVENLPGISDSVAVGQDIGDDVRVILFVKLAVGFTWTDAMALQIKSHIRSQLTPRHVPYKVLPVKDIPYTRSGKKVELAVTKILRGEEVSNKDALANPESLTEYEALLKAELSS